MTTFQLRALLDTEPFQPFTMHLSDGRSVAVDNVEFFSLAEDGVCFILFQPPQQQEIFDPSHVVSARMLGT